MTIEQSALELIEKPVTENPLRHLFCKFCEQGTTIPETALCGYKFKNKGKPGRLVPFTDQCVVCFDLWMGHRVECKHKPERFNT